MTTKVAPRSATKTTRSTSSAARAQPKKRPLGGKLIAPALKRAAPARSTFDAARVRADGSLVLGRRENGPGEVVLTRSGDLLLDGKRGHAAAVEVARLIETGVSPFRHASEVQHDQLVAKLLANLEAPAARKSSSTAVLHRSAAATLLLSLARSANDAKDRDVALGGYLQLLDRETNLRLKTSMLTNLDAAKLPLKKAQAAIAEAARDVVQPEQPPYDKWFKAGDEAPHLEVRQYVMDDFWREELRAQRHRGFKIVSEKTNEVVLTRTLKDPKGLAPDVTVRVVMRREDQNVLRDMADPDVDLVIYSGHAQLGGIADSAVRAGPDEMLGAKLVALFNCRGQQNVAQFKEKYPGAHLSATYSSSYGSDDTLVLDQLYEMIATRGTYAGMRRSLRQADMLQPKSNYILPDDPRQIAYHDDDMDGLRDDSAVGTDRFFNPSRRHGNGGSNSFRLSPVGGDPQELSGVKIDHSVGYANTAFYYFSEENRAAPIKNSQADTFVAAGWFSSEGDEPVRIVERTRHGKTFYEVAVNARLSDKSREVITATVLFELQKYLCGKEGRFDDADKLRALVMVAGYLDLHADYSDRINEVLSGFARQYGFTGHIDYDLTFEALKRDGDEGTATRRTLDYLRAHGVGVAHPPATA